MKLKIIRVEESDQGTFGVMLINDVAFCVTLEPPDKDNQRDMSSIPPGAYTCRRVQSPRHGTTFEITHVPNRSHILFHAGNVVGHTKGCILLGQYFGKLRGERAVLNSGNTFRQFMGQTGGAVTLELDIINLCGPIDLALSYHDPGSRG